MHITPVKKRQQQSQQSSWKKKTSFKRNVPGIQIKLDDLLDLDTGIHPQRRSTDLTYSTKKYIQQPYFKDNQKNKGNRSGKSKISQFQQTPIKKINAILNSNASQKRSIPIIIQPSQSQQSVKDYVRYIYRQQPTSMRQIPYQQKSNTKKKLLGLKQKFKKQLIKNNQTNKKYQNYFKKNRYYKQQKNNQIKFHSNIQNIQNQKYKKLCGQNYINNMFYSNLANKNSIPQLFRYCIACQQPILQLNIIYHQQHCLGLQQLYQQKLNSLKNYLNSKINILIDYLNKQLLNSKDNHYQQIQQLKKSVINWLGHLKQNVTPDYQYKQCYEKVKQKYQCGIFMSMQTVSKVNWFMRVKARIQEAIQKEQMRNIIE